MSNEKSDLIKDGMPTFYIAENGHICTHRLSIKDEPVWCSVEAFDRITRKRKAC